MKILDWLNWFNAILPFSVSMFITLVIRYFAYDSVQNGKIYEEIENEEYSED